MPFSAAACCANAEEASTNTATITERVGNENFIWSSLNRTNGGIYRKRRAPMSCVFIIGNGLEIQSRITRAGHRSGKNFASGGIFPTPNPASERIFLESRRFRRHATCSASRGEESMRATSFFYRHYLAAGESFPTHAAAVFV